MTDSETEVVLVSERFHPDTTSASGQYMTDIAIGLQERGLNVQVLSRSIHGMSDEETDDRLEDAGVTVKRTPIPDMGQSSFPRRLLNWVTFLVIAVPLLLCSQSRKERYIVFVSYPTVMPPLLWAVCKIRRWEYMYIIHDYHPEAAVELGYLRRGGVVHRLWEQLDRALLVDASDVVVLGPRMRERVVEKVTGKASEFDETKVRIIHNWADGGFIRPRTKAENWFSEKHGLQGQFSLVYSGNIGKFHDLKTLIEAIAHMENDPPRALIVGEGDNKSTIRALARELGVLDWTVKMLPYQPWDTVPYSLTAGDVSVVAVNPEFEGLCVSSKLYSALAAGQPILVIANETDDEAQIVEQFDAGIQVTPGDMAGVVTAIKRWRDDPTLIDQQGHNARQAFEEHFTRETSVDQYYEIISS